jgi:branched-chain amino acid transport system substrate-binding protein
LRSKSPVLKVFAVLAVVALVGAACKKDEEPTTSGNTAAEKTKVTVYFQGAWTGPYNYLVISSIQGAQLKFKELNAEADFPATVTVKAADTQGGGDSVPQIATTVVNDPDTVAVEGPAFSGETRAAGDTYNDAKIPFVTQSATAVDLASFGWDYWYRTVGNDDLQGGNDGKFLADVVGAKKLYLADDTSDYGKPLAETVGRAAEDGGVTIAGTNSVAPTDDYSALISDIEASGADTVFYGGYDADFGKLLKQASDAGLDVQWMSGDGSVSSTLLDTAGDAAEGVYLSIPSNLAGDFVTKFNDEYGSKASSVPVYAAEGYDAAGLIGEGIKEAIDGGATDVAGIREGIKTYLDSVTVDNPYQGEAKPIAFDDKHEVTASDPNSLLYFYQVKGGEITEIGKLVTSPRYLWPQFIRRHDVVRRR